MKEGEGAGEGCGLMQCKCWRRRASWLRAERAVRPYRGGAGGGEWERCCLEEARQLGEGGDGWGKVRWGIVGCRGCQAIKREGVQVLEDARQLGEQG